MKTVVLNGERHHWSDILKARREQKKAQRQNQPALFEMKEDHRPLPERTADDRFLQPSLFEEKQ